MDELKLDPAFTIPGEKSLMLPADSRMGAGRFLSYQLARHPENLRQHAQRIFLLISSRETGPLFGALVDLFIALGDKGEDLRKRLLGLARPLLTNEDYEFLARHQRQGLEARHAKTDLKGSVLSEGFCGSNILVSRERSQAGFADPLQEALSLLEFGQLDEARLVLEKEYLSNPSRKEVEDELADVYRHTRDRSDYDVLTKELLRRGAALSGGWRMLGEDLAKTE
ncbi:MAG: hypothetical protein A2514_04470 [Gammaproteobacteria bacterium RIFOXYD12_FULL_61_37]|nr:MAG: hypothetical protein A2514_04470 [Gammaproteobacteria bacterium RIFOXYD12_FULL_61_37]